MNKKWWVLLGTGLAGIMIAIDFTIVNTSLSNIQSDLHASMNQLQWLMSGFGLSFCAFLVTFGRLADLLGRRKILYINIIGFACASLGAGFATSANFLIAMRIVQGFFAAGVFPCGMALTAAAFPEEERVKALGIYGSLIGVGLAFGPVLGSLINWLSNWRWIFFVNIPIICTCIAIFFFAVKESRLSSKVSIDWLGAALLVTALGALTFAINEGAYYGWSSKLIVASFMVTIATTIVFFFVEQRCDTPILPLHLLTNSGFLLGLIIYISSISFAWSVMFFTPLYLHNVAGYSTEISGLLLSVMTFMTIAGPLVSSHFYNKHKIATINFTFLMTTSGVLSLYLLQANGPLLLIIIGFLLFGFGWGMGNGIATPTAISKLKNTNDTGVVSGALITAMNMFGVIILTIVTTISEHRENFLFFKTAAAKKIPLNNTDISHLKALLADPTNAEHVLKIFPQHLLAAITDIYKTSLLSGIHFALLVMLIVKIAMWIIAAVIIKKSFCNNE